MIQFLEFLFLNVVLSANLICVKFHQMAQNNIGSLVVLKPEGHIAGIVTERGNFANINKFIFINLLKKKIENVEK